MLRSTRRDHLRLLAASTLALGAARLTPLVTKADGVIIIEPPECQTGACPTPTPISGQLIVTNHHVDVTIENQVATTKIDQNFHNPNSWAAEGTYLFPIPDGASIDHFTMVVDGQTIEAKILDAVEARGIYEQIVRQMKDPALLEYVGRGAIQASIYPIPPGGDRRIQIEYQQIVPAEQGLIRYVYPLNTERFSAQPLQSVSVKVAVASKDPVRAIYSPSHTISTQRADDFHFVSGWEGANVTPDTDFELIYTVSQEQIAANLLSYVDPATAEGTFMLLAAPGISPTKDLVAKDVLIVLDTSGSMEGEKLAQAKQAVDYILAHLNQPDRFALLEFNTSLSYYATSLSPQSQAAPATAWVEALAAGGGTDINRALLEALGLVDKERPTYLLFLTDGLPTEGETDIDRIIANVSQSAPSNVRLFAFGVGDDVDTILLDTLTQDLHGVSTYVRPGQRIDEEVSAFYGKISAPVLTSIALTVSGVTTEDLYPRPLPDLFSGTQLVVLGRYKTGGPAKLTLTGQVNGATMQFDYADQAFATAGGAPGLPRLWATRKIGYLLNQIRINGQNTELVQEVVNLSVRYGIVTPYTSYLITDQDVLTAEGRDSAAKASANAQPAPSIGSAAVNEAAAVNDMAGGMGGASGAAAPASVAGNNGSGGVRVIGSRAFVQQNGVWIETTFDPSKMKTTKVVFGSDAYFKLLADHPDLGPAFALGHRVIALSGGVAYEVTEK